jgi:hypothetical protein
MDKDSTVKFISGPIQVARLAFGIFPRAFLINKFGGITKLKVLAFRFPSTANFDGGKMSI